jgi:hypothetical protein
VAFGNRLGFANAWSYWITAWTGNAAIAFLVVDGGEQANEARSGAREITLRRAMASLQPPRTLAAGM